MSNKIKSNNSNSDSTTQVLAFILILFFILFAYKYFSTNYSYSQDHDIRTPDKDKVRCPPNNITKSTDSKPSNITDSNEIEDETILMHENDLKIIHNKFHLYENTNDIDNPGFENELGNNLDIDKSLSHDLDTVYLETSAQNFEHTDHDTCSYSKEQKSDLPLANVPIFVLTNEKPVRLSDMRI